REVFHVVVRLVYFFVIFFFFFSSRRRHTRWPRDWSSDVCSSDLQDRSITVRRVNYFYGHGETRSQVLFDNRLEIGRGEVVIMTRSEERRVGKECRCRWGACE